MDTSKIIKGVVNSGRYTVTAPIVKEDYGLYLQIEGVELPQTYEVDFSNSEHSGTSVTMIGNSDGVLIPHQFIDTGKDVFAFLYHVGANYGRTVYKFRIPNKARPYRTSEQPTPEEQSTIDQLIGALNTAVEQTAQDVIDADASAQSASRSAENAHDSAVDAQNYAESAQTSANNASASASQASASATASAQSASQSAQIKADVEDLADDAQGYAQASAQSAQASAQSASQALSSAQSASASATNAQGYASNAQTSANTASSKATEASGYASTASQKATEASQSASQALTYKNDAESAKTASQTAQGLAESARDTAVSAKTDAESARDDAVQAKEDAESAVASISGALDDKAPVITDTASGSIASFTDGADNLPLKSLVVDINPIQDLHGQDSPYPAGGGKNVFPPPTSISPSVTTTIANDKGVLTISSTGGGQSGIHIPEFTFAESGQKIELLNSFTNATIRFCYQGEQVDYFSLSYANRVIPEASITALQGKTIDEYRIHLNGATSGTLAVMVTPSSDSALSAFSPYENLCPISGWTEVNVNHSDADMTNPTTLTIQLGQTVYGGKLDVLSGVLTVDRAMHDMGDLAWEKYQNNGLFYSITLKSVIKKGSLAGGYDNAISSAYAPANVGSLSALPDMSLSVDSGGNIQIRDSRHVASTGAEFKAALGGAQFAYELATPLTIQLTPNQVNSLLGVNNIWADSGDTEVEYRADTKLYINRLTEPDADMIADSNIVSGQYFMVGNSLYKATANIANGSAIVVGTNCIRKSLSEALNEINA